MSTHAENRNLLLMNLREELVGPAPRGEEIDCSGSIDFEKKDVSYGPWRQKGTAEEILIWERPTVRYGVGVLYPPETAVEAESPETETAKEADATQDQAEFVTDKALADLETIEKNSVRSGVEPETDDLELSSANILRPSSMGISFLADLPEESQLVVMVPSSNEDGHNTYSVNGRYSPKTVKVENSERTWWLRIPVAFTAEFEATQLCQDDFVPAHAERDIDGLRLSVEVYSRAFEGEKTRRLITVCLVNRTQGGSPDKDSLFQAYFRAFVRKGQTVGCIRPYPVRLSAYDEEEESLQLVYRHSRTFAAGHGCAADWKMDDRGAAIQVAAECLPLYETPNVTPHIRDRRGEEIKVSMAEMAGLVPDKEGFDSLENLISLYETWIVERRSEIEKLEGHYQKTARRHMDNCVDCAERMRSGLQLLRSNSNVQKAFRLANHALLLQQLTGGDKPRKGSFDRERNIMCFNPEYSVPDLSTLPSRRGYWWAFQIAFILMSLPSTAAGKHPDRRVVELIWFPTGGGKTEAYLGLAAFSIFLRRLEGSDDTGVNVMMRYTLRLLTAQQFQRASRLICSMEFLRRRNTAQLGQHEISIGIWVGRENTPNRRTDATRLLRNLERQRLQDSNPFVLDRCPWCGAQMGHYSGSLPRGVPRVHGYCRSGQTVVFKCPDQMCEFKQGLPVYVIDEDIYEQRPDLIIGTIDKFAMIAWKPEARSLFGISEDGERLSSPPRLIIQDELHLISGPLGSMTGLYETVVEELCTDRSAGEPIPPKIVCSTATIRRFSEQIHALFGRNHVKLLPPPGLDVSDSFFAQYERDNEDRLKPGKIYVGIHAPGLGSMQTIQVRTFTALLQGSLDVAGSDRDPWWTFVLFFNSLRELGTTISLLQSDIPDRIRVLRRRYGFQNFLQRRLWRILELTSRLRSDKIPEKLADLEKHYEGKEGVAVDVCLATSIIEVGIDVPRLSLMAVVGQPKTTSQYIQVTGRVGREIPGLVVTLYSPTKPRDRSHFEKFRSYHERLYAQVEPTSVTPFSSPVLDRALHAILVSYVRQKGGPEQAETPYPVPARLISEVRPILLSRVDSIDSSERQYAEQLLVRLVREWETRKKTKWGKGMPHDDALLRAAGTYATPEQARQSWATPTSMRNVDAECQAEITRLYMQAEEEGAHA